MKCAPHRWLRLLLCCLPVCCPHQAAAEGPPDLARIRHKGELVVALIAEDSPPFVFRDAKGNLKGLDVELLSQAAEHLQVKVRFVRPYNNYDDLLDSVREGKADVAATAVYPTLHRAETLLFTDPYFTIASVLAINRVERAKGRAARSADELFNRPGNRIGFYQSAGTQSIAKRNFPRATLVGYVNRDKMLPDLLAGRLLGGLIDELEARKWEKQVPDLNVYLSLEREARAEREIAFALDWKAQGLQQWLNLFLREYRQNGELSRLIETHFGKRQLGEAE